MYIVDKFALIFGCDGNDVIHSQISEDSCLYLYFLCVHLPFYLITSLQLFQGHYSCILKHRNAFRIKIIIENDRTTCLTIQASSSSLLFPFIRVSIAVKTDRGALFYVTTNDLNNGFHRLFSAFDKGINIFLECNQLVGYCCVKRNHCAGAVRSRSYSTEFKTVTRKCKRRSAVTIRIVNHKFGYLRYIKFHPLLTTQRDDIIAVVFSKMLQHFR